MTEDKVRKTIKAYKKLAKTYAKQNENRAHIYSEIVKFTKLLPQNGSLLDLGCGTGFDSKDFQKLRPDLTILGIDISKEMLEEFEKIAPGIEHIRADMVTYIFPKNVFDGIWMNASFLHIPKENADTVIKKVVGALKPQGLLYIRVKEGSGEKFVPAQNYGHKDIERFFSFYTKDELENLLSKYPVKIIELGEGKVKTTKWIFVTAIKN